eukprot:530429-Prorocentrum_lima.AAC.1
MSMVRSDSKERKTMQYLDDILHGFDGTTIQFMKMLINDNLKKAAPAKLIAAIARTAPGVVA